ncbi:hypothetical protein RM780_22370 [Streptomyces sp. DSM 44917]|uniref:Uncharacterized protein n=1 Tax=Streptomyces boetiae TaxID=3075541 RepID=A0ABU2LDN6_9ACTN|nr:hypothetical protein [Streptomyces sp. DSM 44917]MDT0309681.1 hypothetical protein [Streptomyces sp. DSM 44917]
MAAPTVQAPWPAPGSSLALLIEPYIFTQDDLLSTDKFIAQAKDRGIRISLDLLQVLHSERLLLPLYRVSDTPAAGRQIAIADPGTFDTRFQVFRAASEGRLRDPAEEGYAAAWPHVRPSDEPQRGWWNGFVYSSWQLLDLPRLLRRHQNLHFERPPWPVERRKDMMQHRRQMLALSALSTQYLPSVLGRVRFSNPKEEEPLRRYRTGAEVLDTLHRVGFDPADLRGAAERFLFDAHSDPLHKWLPILRHASYRAWSQLRGEPLQAMWRRVAAEILLRAHEDLTTSGVLDPLPDLTGTTWWTVQHDRLTQRHVEATTLERALADFGLSPHPKVILLVEGETELYHVTRLLEELGVNRPQDVRVQRTKGSKINAHLIARYGVTPRVGRRLSDRWLLDATPTALVIAMDPENHFATQADRDKVRRDLQDAIREEVRYQDADIGQDFLDYLVQIRVWGEDKYELANFTDDELVAAITTLATRQGNPRVTAADWEHNARTYLAEARSKHLDIKAPLGRLGMREEKVALAGLLWPTLLAKAEAEYAADDITTPVVQLIADVLAVRGRIAGVRALVGPEVSDV